MTCFPKCEAAALRRVRHLARRAADEEEEQRLLDVLVAEDLRRDRLRHRVVEVVAPLRPRRGAPVGEAK